MNACIVAKFCLFKYHFNLAFLIYIIKDINDLIRQNILLNFGWNIKKVKCKAYV